LSCSLSPPSVSYCTPLVPRSFFDALIYYDYFRLFLFIVQLSFPSSSPLSTFSFVYPFSVAVGFRRDCLWAASFRPLLSWHCSVACITAIFSPYPFGELKIVVALFLSAVGWVMSLLSLPYSMIWIYLFTSTGYFSSRSVWLPEASVSPPWFYFFHGSPPPSCDAFYQPSFFLILRDSLPFPIRPVRRLLLRS